MLQIIEEALGWVDDYLGNLLSWPLAAAVVFIAIGIPVLHAASGKTGKWTKPGRVLFSYVGLTLLGLLAFYGLGITLYKIAPSIFDAWRQGVDYGPGVTFVTVLIKFVYVWPLAFGVSSVVYGALGGWKKFVIGLLGVAGAVGLATIAFGGIIAVACYGWASCI